MFRLAAACALSLALLGMIRCRNIAVLFANVLLVASAVFWIEGHEFPDSSSDEELTMKFSRTVEGLVAETIWDCWSSEVGEFLGWTEENIVAQIAAIPRVFDYVHFFCGQRSLDRQLRAANLFGIGFDKVVHPLMDFNSRQGAILAIIAVLAVKAGGVLGGGPECKSWLCFLTRSITKRNSHNIEGDQNRPFVTLLALSTNKGAYLSAQLLYIDPCI